MKHRKVVKGLGFTRLNQVIERQDTAAIRGMVKKMPHLVEIVKSKVSKFQGRKVSKLRSAATWFYLETWNLTALKHGI